MGRLLFVVTLLLALIAISSAGSPVYGGKKPANVNDPRVVTAAQFAATQFGTLSAPASLVLVRKAETQIVAGTNYYLLIYVQTGNTKQNYQVVVYEKLDHSYQLTSSAAANDIASCPPCTSMVIIHNAKGCYGGPQDGCGCCTLTGDLAFKPPHDDADEAQLCTTLLNGSKTCETFPTLAECNSHLAACQKKNLKPWLCGTCSPVKE